LGEEGISIISHGMTDSAVASPLGPKELKSNFFRFISSCAVPCCSSLSLVLLLSDATLPLVIIKKFCAASVNVKTLSFFLGRKKKVRNGAEKRKLCGATLEAKAGFAAEVFELWSRSALESAAIKRETTATHTNVSFPGTFSLPLPEH
jgi:hypothetical protein